MKPATVDNVSSAPMRADPAFLSWVIRCESEDTLRKVKGWLVEHIHQDFTIVDEVSACPDGLPTRWHEPHRLGQYFTDVRPAPGPPEEPTSLRVIFHRRPDAGRFWKDFMVRFLQMVRNLSRDVTIALDYRGDEEPAETAQAGR